MDVRLVSLLLTGDQGAAHIPHAHTVAEQSENLETLSSFSLKIRLGQST